MKPLPNINDEPAMLKRGKLSAIASARNDAFNELRDAVTLIQSAQGHDIEPLVNRVKAAVDRVATLAAMWDEVA